MTKEGLSIQGTTVITLTAVKVTSDLTVARFYFSIFNSDDKKAVLKSLAERKNELKRKLGEDLRFHLRRIPELEFFADETMEQAHRIEELFKEINKPKE